MEVIQYLLQFHRTLQLGNQVDQSQLTNLLPEKYTVVAQEAEDNVESEVKNTNGDGSSKDSK